MLSFSFKKLIKFYLRYHYCCSSYLSGPRVRRGLIGGEQHRRHRQGRHYLFDSSHCFTMMYLDSAEVMDSYWIRVGI